MTKVKITVVKKVNNKDLYGETPPAPFDENRILPECDRFEVRNAGRCELINL